MIPTRELQYFLTIVQEGSILAAAQTLHMAQPPLSRSIKQLEETLGCKLFERGPRKITLTAAGKIFQNRAEQMMKLMSTTLTEVKEFQAGNQGTLSIGTATSCGVTVLPKVANIFHQQYPNLKFELWEESSVRITELIKTGIIELGLIRFSFDADTFNIIRLPREPLVAAIPLHEEENFPKTSYLSLAELAEKPLMIHRKYETILTEKCQQAGFDPHYLSKAGNILPLLAWADAGVGIAIVPKAAIGMIPTPNLSFRTITDPLVELNAAIIWLRNHELSPAAQNFLDVFMTLHTI